MSCLEHTEAAPVMQQKSRQHAVISVDTHGISGTLTQTLTVLENWLSENYLMSGFNCQRYAISHPVPLGNV